MIRNPIANNSELQLVSDILANVKDCIIVLDNDYKICYWNKGAYYLLGLDEYEVIGKSIFKLFNWPELFAILHNPQIKHYEDTQKIKVTNNEEKAFRVRINTVSYHNNLVEYTVIILTDISELVEAEMQEKRANLAKSEFMANLSHEIRTPLVGILGFCELLTHKELGEQEIEYVETIEFCAHQLMGLVNNVLDLSKIEAGQVEISKKPFNLRQMVKQLILSIRPDLAKKDLVCLKDIDAKIPELLIGDELKIQQVLTNLVTNAIKYTDTGSIKIHIEESYYGTKSGLTNVKISVYDTGPGIESNLIEQIFKPFVQLNKSGECSGAGLGLAISKRIVETMNGTIWYEPNIERGSIFSFVLPLEKVAEEVSETASIYNHIPEIMANNTKILLAEDIAINRKLITYMLKNMGCEVIQAANGKECLEKLQENNPDIIIMDMQMPVLDGYETTRQIRGKLSWQNIPIIALTAYAMTSDIDKCIEAGCNYYLSKPFTQAQLCDVLNKCFFKEEQSIVN